jgi:hypothetical protein
MPESTPNPMSEIAEALAPAAMAMTPSTTL